MNSLILLLFVAASLQTQALPDAARKERQRQANLQPQVVFTGEKPDQTTPATSKQTDAARPAVRPPTAKAVEDAAKRYAEQLAQLRVRVIELQDRDTATQLELNDVRNQFLAPITDTTARQQAQERLEQLQIQLTAIEKELADTKRAVQIMEIQGPPKPR